MGFLIFFGSGGFGYCLRLSWLVVAGDHRCVVSVSFRKPRHDILDVVTEVNTVRTCQLFRKLMLAADFQRFHLTYYFRLF